MCFEPGQYDQSRTQLIVLKQSLKNDGFEHSTPNRSAAVEKLDDDFQRLNEMLQVIKVSKDKNLTRMLTHIQSAISKFDEDIDSLGDAKNTTYVFPWVSSKSF